jgi:hypothetical protein
MEKTIKKPKKNEGWHVFRPKLETLLQEWGAVH